MHNVIKGSQQNFELSAALNSQNIGSGELNDLGEDGEDSLQGSSAVRQNFVGGGQIRD